MVVRNSISINNSSFIYTNKKVLNFNPFQLNFLPFERYKETSREMIPFATPCTKVVLLTEAASYHHSFFLNTISYFVYASTYVYPSTSNKNVLLHLYLSSLHSQLFFKRRKSLIKNKFLTITKDLLRANEGE